MLIAQPIVIQVDVRLRRARFGPISSCLGCDINHLKAKSPSNEQVWPPKIMENRSLERYDEDVVLCFIQHGAPPFADRTIAYARLR
jgi:hypothetical protein